MILTHPRDHARLIELWTLLVSLLLTSCAFDTLRSNSLQRDWGIKVPVLMYHRIVPDDYWASTASGVKRPDRPPAVGIGDRADPYLYLRSQSEFRQEMEYLAKTGYTPISLYQLKEYFQSRNPAVLPKKPVVISFDDGSTDWFEFVYPLLSKLNFKATFFIITNDEVRGQFITGRAPLSWEQIRQMAQHKDRAGRTLFDFESHSHNHISLADAAMQSMKSNDGKTLRHELAESMRVLQQQLGKKPSFIALPYGAGGFDQEPDTQVFPLIKAVTQELGYMGIRTSRSDIPNDLSTDSYKIGAQIIIYSSTTMGEFRDRLNRLATNNP